MLHSVYSTNTRFTNHTTDSNLNNNKYNNARITKT